MRRPWLVLTGGAIAVASVASMAVSMATGEAFAAGWVGAFGIYGVVGLLIAWNRPGNTVGRLFLLLGLVVPVAELAAAYGRAGLPGGDWAALASSASNPVVFGSLMLFLPLLFPTGSFLSPRWARFGVVAALLLGTISLLLWLTPGPLDCCPGVRNPIGIPSLRGLQDLIGLAFPVVALMGVVAFGSLLLRYRRAREEERLQIKWFTFAGAAVLLAALGGSLASIGILPEDSDLIPIIVFPTTGASIAVAVGVAILRYRLYDIEIVINKTLVYGALAAFITALYVGVVVGIGAFVGTRGEPNLALQIGATALVAVLFQPVRGRIQRLANRLVYGARSTPYEVMAEFGERMAGSLRVEEVLPQVAEAAARGVGAAAARARIELAGGSVREARWPEGDGAEGTERVLTVTHRGEPVGEIAVTKAPGDPPRPQDEALLKDLATQAGLALHNVRLAEELRGRVEQISRQAEELRASQQRIVTAADDARRLLEQAIEERVERRIDDLAERLRAATGLIDEDPDRGAAALEEAGVRTQATLDELREIARGIYPPLLADKGLAAALDAQARRGGGTLRLRVEGVGRYGQEIEAGIYFCCLEAMQQGAEALTIDVREEQEVLRFAIELEDGLEGERLVRIADRVEALGGELVVADEAGTAISAMIPVDPATIPA